MSFKAVVFVVLVVLAAGSAGARAMLSEGGGSGPPTGASGLVSGLSESASAAGTPSGDALAEALPYLTEGSFFALIGFGVGYLGRKVLKLLLIFAAILFLAVQGLAYLEIATVDWSKALDVVNGVILNVQEGETWQEVLKHKLPSAGALMVGFALGFRKG